ncbi:MAG: carboxypeptidase-like regulatory domain-containing protein, partial [Oligoflexus sp.]|nr:carboxypeptidase-like regulatory domain-containing protein [Pseudopedobacter sp.]
MKKIFILIFIIQLTSSLFAQEFTIKGKITDNQKQVIPFTTIFIKGTSKGTSANREGEFVLKVNKGRYDLAFSAIGFKQLVKPVDVDKNIELGITLNNEVFELKDVVVKSGGEDPAYAIIRKAIKQRKKYLKETPPYTCDVYIKGIQKLLKAPEKFLGRDIKKVGQEIGLDSNRTGILYQSESQSILSFLPPNSYHEEMISSKVAGGNRSFSFNRATELLLNFYENTQDWNGLSNRPFVSPIADNALFYYDYKLIGTSVENGEFINKIQILPKRKYDPAYRGYIYIVEDSWRIHSTDFLMSKESNINLLDTLKINQTYIPLTRKTWMPSNLKFEFVGGLFGFRFGGYYVGIYSNYALNPKLEAKDFKEVVKITKEVNKKDSTYWSNVRPIPLTKEETNNYVKKDSIAKRRESKPYLDSLDKVNNNLKFGKFLMTGYNPRNRYKKEFYHIDGFLPALFFNTVEGFGFNYGASYTKRIDTINNRLLSLKGNIRYGFSNKLFNANTSANIPIGKKLSLGLGLGSDVLDLNDNGTLSTLGNTINSLFYERNFSKFYQKKYGEANLSSRLPFGLSANVGLAYQNNKWLPNSTGYAFRNDPKSDYTSNNPYVPQTDFPLFQEYQNFNINAAISYNFSSKYVTYPTGRFYLPSKWPVLTLNYK